MKAIAHKFVNMKIIGYRYESLSDIQMYLLANYLVL